MTGVQIALELNLPQRTVSRHLIEAQLSRQKDIEPRDEDSTQRKEHETLGDMIHFDIKTLRNFNEEARNRHKSANKAAGTQCMQVAVDDYSRYATESVLEDEIAESVTKHLIATYQHYESKGIVVQLVLTDNGSGYRSKMFADSCQNLNLKQVCTQPYTPKTNGKAERSIQTLLREWAFVRT